MADAWFPPTPRGPCYWGHIPSRLIGILDSPKWILRLLLRGPQSWDAALVIGRQGDSGPGPILTTLLAKRYTVFYYDFPPPDGTRQE